MAYTPTEWETGDVITAAKLNNMEQGIEDAFVAPEVAAADQGKVLTVDSSGDWDAASIKDVLVFTGSCKVNLQTYSVIDLSVTGEPTEIPEYKSAYLKLGVIIYGVDVPLMEVMMPYTEHILFDIGDQSATDFYAFEADIVMSVSSSAVTMAHLHVEHDNTTNTWSGSIFPWQISRS